MSKYKNILIIVGVVIVAILLLKIFNEEERTVTVIETKIVKVVDTIKVIEIKEKPVIKYVYKNKKEIVYVDKEIFIKDTTKTVIEANEYKTTLESNRAIANLSVLTTGELLDIKGTISYPKETKTITTTKYIHNSSMFVYGQLSIAGYDSNSYSSAGRFNQRQLGIDYVIKDKVILGVSGSNDASSDIYYFNIKVGIKIF